MKQETPEEFLKGCDIDKVLATARQLGGTHIVRFEVLDMCSSKFGDSKSVIIGPTCTIKTLEEAGEGKLDMELASTIKWPVAYMEVPGED